ncbi:hypothetical protein SLEP1_g3294 [Rubroshorea leprosula]|uniref:Uncharacterized protein n=1 Tax=Rubroshorea leprosula TaxID=152421 RepID=A0AAV5HJV8_9ROSI|nr:hypothetical protein SLEP1_g3294 [Rubroshorea leprosula]
MYIDPTVPRNHKTIDCLTEIIFRYYGVISLQNHEHRYWSEYSTKNPETSSSAHFYSFQLRTLPSSRVLNPFLRKPIACTSTLQSLGTTKPSIVKLKLSYDITE